MQQKKSQSHTRAPKSSLCDKRIKMIDKSVIDRRKHLEGNGLRNPVVEEFEDLPTRSSFAERRERDECRPVDAPGRRLSVQKLAGGEPKNGEPPQERRMSARQLVLTSPRKLTQPYSLSRPTKLLYFDLFSRAHLSWPATSLSS